MDLDGLKRRIGVDLGRKYAAEEGIAWAADNDVRVVDIEIDAAPNALATFLGGRGDALRAACAAGGIKLGLHTLSAVNVAELSPFVSDAVDQYLRAYIAAARRLGAGWVVVHAGYHFTGDYKARRQAALERLKRVVGHAEEQGVTLLLENLNREPADAEVHYLAFNLEEWSFYLDAIRSPALRSAFTVNHAHLVPEGIAGHLAALDVARLVEVRLADNRGDKEQHLKPGEGTIDFVALFEHARRRRLRRPLHERLRHARRHARGARVLSAGSWPPRIVEQARTEADGYAAVWSGSIGYCGWTESRRIFDTASRHGM
jgi:sugar phosphate isomerase/epimerase